MANSRNLKRKNLLAVSIGVALAFGTFTPVEVLGQAPDDKPTIEQIRAALEKSESNPASAKQRFEYAELLRKAGKKKQAFKEYLAVTDIDASYYVSYHMIAVHCTDKKILVEATKRLTHLKESKPKELMLRVALSELLEAQGDYYRASRALVDIVYLNVIPAKYKKKVHDRILYLQAKARDAHAQKHSVDVASAHESTEADPPLPEETLKKGLAASRISPENQADDIGNVNVEH